MHQLAHKLKELGSRRIAFSLVVLVYLGFLGFINLMMFIPGNWMSDMGHFDFVYTGETHDLIHELVFALLVGTAGVGLLSQLWKPKENYAGQLIALIVWAVMILASLVTNNVVPQPLYIIFGGLTIIATFLHPAGRDLFNWIRSAKMNKAMLALVLVATVPLIVFAFTNINLQRAGMNMYQNESGEFLNLFGHKIPKHGGSENKTMPTDVEAVAMDDGMVHDQKHSALGHYKNIAALSFIIILAGLLASFRPRGYRLAAWIAGTLPVLLGLASVVLPEAESALGLGWGIAAVVWGIVFIATAESTREGVVWCP